VAIGFVLVHVLPLYEHEVFNKLSKFHDVIEIHPLLGEYDLIAKIESAGHENIGESIIKKIRTIDGITDTRTLTTIGLG
jgi:DNA-binding Lrp family transcriptional regulator